jgi:CRP-like cAMP-binding protein
LSTSHFSLPEEFHTPLKQIAVAKSFSARRLLFQKGDPVQGVYLIETGRVALSLVDVPGLPPRIVGSGALLGLPSTIGGRPYSFTAEALEPVEAGFIPREEFMMLLKQYPGLCLALVQGLAWEITEARQQSSQLLEEKFSGQVGRVL